MLYVNPQAEAGFRGAALSPGAATRETQALQEFEQLFLYQMLKEMRNTVPEGGLLGDGMKKGHFEEMMDDFLAGEMAASGQLGIAREMAAQLHAKTGDLPPHSLRTNSDTRAEIPLQDGSIGIPLPAERPPGIAISRGAPAIPLDEGDTKGIPLHRAHESYRANQSGPRG